MTPALEIQDVCKTYHDGKREVVANKEVTLAIKSGQIFGLLGPNGAGKSTLIGMISGWLRPDRGTIRLFGQDIIADPGAKNMLGVVPQELTMESAFTVQEVLWYTAGLAGVPVADRQPQIDTLLEQLELTGQKNAKARAMSGGQRRRLMVAKAVIHRPKFLILDEPTAGVDIKLRQNIWSLVRELNESGTTILFTTHYLEEAEQLCDEIAFIDRGTIIRQGTLAELQSSFGGGVVFFELFESAKNHLDGVKELPTEFELATTNLAATLAEITAKYGKNLKAIRSENASLEKIFLELTGKK